jgi:4,5-dihydroxyphthalate decarboxylase
VNLQASVTPLTFACGVYDRTVPLFTREVKIEGVDLTYVPIEDPREIFDRMAGGEPFDLSEMSLSEYICRYVAGQNPFVALPVFPSRVFRHSMITVNRKTVSKPTDLAGKRIGVPLYTMTAAVFIRGLLQHDHGVDLSNVHWVQGAVNHASSHGDPTAMPLLKPVDIENNASGRSLSDLLATGEIDAIIGTGMPASLKTSPDVVRLFPNFREVEQDYYRRTHIFPIMHTVVMQRAVFDRDPSLAPRLYAGFSAAKELARKRMTRPATLSYMLPWMIDDLEEIERVFGGDPWPYGVEPNRVTLEALVTYLVEQNMIARTVPIEELFASAK